MNVSVRKCAGSKQCPIVVNKCAGSKQCPIVVASVVRGK